MGAAIPASSVVTTALQGDVLVVTIDNPPVNALGAAVRQGLLAAMLQAQADAAAIARAVLYDPRWPWHAAAALGETIAIAPQYLRSAPREVAASFVEAT